MRYYELIYNKKYFNGVDLYTISPVYIMSES